MTNYDYSFDDFMASISKTKSEEISGVGDLNGKLSSLLELAFKSGQRSISQSNLVSLNNYGNKESLSKKQGSR